MNSRSQSSLSGRDSDSMDNEVTLSKMDVVLSFALEVSVYKTFLNQPMAAVGHVIISKYALVYILPIKNSFQQIVTELGKDNNVGTYAVCCMFAKV